MQYQGILFNKDFPKGRKSGFLMVQPDRIIFSSDDYELSLPLRRIEIKSGGAADRLLYFTNFSEPEVTLCTSDQEILENQNLNLDPDCSVSIARLKKSKRKSYSIIFFTLAFLAISLSLPFIFQNAIINFAANRVPFEVEQKYGDIVFKTVTNNKTILDDEYLNSQLIKIASPLVNVARQSYPKFNFNFYIVDDPALNAFALPGGKVVVYSGLLLEVESPEEIAALLAHEIAHVTCRHHIRQAFRKIGIIAVIGAITGNSTISEKLGAYGGSLLTLKHSRDAEFEADAAGQKYLRQANINHSGFILLLNRLKSNNQAKKLENVLDILSTHPPTDQRIEKLEIENTQLPDNREYHEFDVNFTEFQGKLADALK